MKDKFQDLKKTLEDIVKGCQQQKARAQKDIYNLLGAKMYAVCLRYASNADDAKDILQDGFIKIFDKIHQFNFQGSIEGWMRRIFVNTALEKYRSQYTVINIQDGWREIDDKAHEDIVSAITVDELVGLVQELSPKYRAVFNLYAIEGYSHKEISEMLEISQGTSKSNLSRARLILQEKVAKQYDTDTKMRL